MSYYSKSSSGGPGCLYAVILAVALGLSIIPGVIKVSDEHWETVTITDKDIKNKEKNSKYLIWADKVDGKECKTCGEPASTTYEITDSLFKWRWDSSDLYGSLEVGKTYEIRIAGARWPFFSMYQNIYEAHEVKPTEMEGS